MQSIEYHGEQGRVARLEELCLRDNKLDAKCLMDLGLVIGSAAHDLEDLDLSHNCISIITDQDTAAFEYFLRSFAECYVLRRVDFGGNALGMYNLTPCYFPTAKPRALILRGSPFLGGRHVFHE